MKDIQVLSARAARFVAVTTAKVYMPDVVKTVQDRYGFVGPPQTAEEMLAPLDPAQNQPLIFQHGKFVQGQRAIIIDRLEIYSHLTAVDTSTSTDDGDLVLDDLLALNPEVLKESLTRRVYISRLEIVLDASLDAVSPGAAALGASLTAMLSQYLDEEAPAAPFRVASFALLTDPAQRVLPCDFRVERRVKTPFDMNRYYSQAPLRTSDHLAALEQFENYLRTAAQAAALGPTA
jgi:hypothetical protein